MKKAELISDIKGRFSLEKNDFKGLEPYELDMIYDIYSNLSKEYISQTITEYIQGSLTLKRNKNFHNDKDSYSVESCERGIFKSRGYVQEAR